MAFLVDCTAISIQGYLIARVICNLLPVKEPKERSFWLAFAQSWAGCIASTFIFNESPAQKIASGIIAYLIFGFLYYEGSWIRKTGFVILHYFVLLILDFVLQFVMFVEFIEVVKTLPPFEMNMVARLMGTPMVFLLCLGADFWIVRRKGAVMKMITGLGVAMAIIQWIIIEILFIANAEGLIRECIVMSFIFSSVLMGGYIVVMELFRAKMRQQEKEQELEQARLKAEYQYELYQQALKQGEMLRDLRHDMRNQLQTMQYLISTKDKEEQEYAVNMLHELKKRME